MCISEDNTILLNVHPSHSHHYKLNTRASERKHKLSRQAYAKITQFPALQRFKDPIIIGNNFVMCMTFYNCKRKEIEIRLSWSWFEITFLIHRKSYLVIIYLNAPEKLTKSEIMSS